MDLSHPGQPGREKTLEAGFLGPSHLWGAGGTNQNRLSPGRVGADGAVTMGCVEKAVKEVRTHGRWENVGTADRRQEPNPGRRDKPHRQVGCKRGTDGPPRTGSS